MNTLGEDMNFVSTQTIIITLIIILVVLVIITNKNFMEFFHVSTPSDTTKWRSAGARMHPSQEYGLMNCLSDSQIRNCGIPGWGHDASIIVKEPRQTHPEIPYNQLSEDEGFPSSLKTGGDYLLLDTNTRKINEIIAPTHVQSKVVEGFSTPGTLTSYGSFNKLSHGTYGRLEESSFEEAGRVEPIDMKIYGIDDRNDYYDTKYRPFNDVQQRLTFAQVDSPIVNELTYDNSYFDLWKTDVLREINRDKQMAVLLKGKNDVPYDNINQCMSFCSDKKDCQGFTVNKQFLDPEFAGGSLPKGEFKGVKTCNLIMQPPYTSDRHNYERIPNNENYRAHKIRDVEDINNPNNINLIK